MIFIPSQLIKVALTPTVDIAGAYASGDSLTSAVLTVPTIFKDFRSPSRLIKVIVTDAAKQSAALKLMFFDRSITAPVFNTAFDPTDTELGYFVGHVNIATTDYVALNDNSVATVNVDSLYFSGYNSKNLYCVPVSAGTPTYVAATDIRFYLTFDQQ